MYKFLHFGHHLKLAIFSLKLDLDFLSVCLFAPIYVIFAGRSLIDYEQITFCIMDWIKKVFKGRTHKFSEGHYDGHYTEDPQFYAPSGAEVFTYYYFSISLSIFLFSISISRPTSCNAVCGNIRFYLLLALSRMCSIHVTN